MSTHISEKELTWLEDILLSRIDDDEITDGMDEGIFDLSELDGFFTAIVSSPEMILPFQWMPKVWGDYEPEWESVTKLEKVTDIMVAMMNSIVGSLMDEDKMVEPLFNVWTEGNKDNVIVEEWCFGYRRGMSLSPSPWEQDNEDMQQLLSPIKLFGTEAGFKRLEKMNKAEIKTMQSQIASSAHEIHAYFLQQRQHLQSNMTVLDTNKNDNQTLSTYSQQHLEALDNLQLIELMIQNNDRVPRNVINESVKRGDSMAQALEERTQAEGYDDLDDGEWWMHLHAIMILGLMDGQKAADALLSYFDMMEKNNDDNLEDWIAGYYYALSQNKPNHYFNQLKDRCLQKTLSVYVKVGYAQALVAHAQQQGEQALEDMLDWIVERVTSDDEEEYRQVLAVSILLDMPRQRYRPLLEELTKGQMGIGTYFDMRDIARSYNDSSSKPEWESFSDPWSFYTPKEITERQKRWAEESRVKDENNDIMMSPDSYFDRDNEIETFIRDTPKIGRNDPCHCGSGKKYKKCCLH